MKNNSSLGSLYIDQIRDLYNAEGQLVKALPKFVKAANSEELKAAFSEHLDQTEGQVSRLEQIFEMNGEKVRGKKCAAMEGLIEEGKEIMAGDFDGPTLDAAIIAAAQKVEHYEIASYGCLVTWARHLGKDQEADLLQETLDEEKMADE